MKIQDLIIKIKENSLTKEQVGYYYDEMCMLYYLSQERYADLEKEEALYIMAHKELKVSDKALQREFDVTEKGLEKMKLHRTLKGMDKLLSSLKRRTYELI